MISWLTHGLSVCCLCFTNGVTAAHAKLASGWLARLCREGVEPSEPIRKVSVLHHIPPSRAYPDASWAHLRPKVIEAEKAAPEIARETIEMVRALYAIEKQAGATSVRERLKLRQERSAPVLADLRLKFLRWSRLFGQVFRVFKWNYCSS